MAFGMRPPGGPIMACLDLETLPPSGLGHSRILNGKTQKGFPKVPWCCWSQVSWKGPGRLSETFFKILAKISGAVEWPTIPSSPVLVQQNIGISSCAVLGWLGAMKMKLWRWWPSLCNSLAEFVVIYLSKQTCFSLVNVSVAQVFVPVKEMIEQVLDTLLHVFHIWTIVRALCKSGHGVESVRLFAFKQTIYLQMQLSWAWWYIRKQNR